jgi:hypothetical protein
MANSTLSASIIAAEAVEILDNNLVMAKNVFRGYEEEFDKRLTAIRSATRSPSASPPTSPSVTVPSWRCRT